MLSKMSAPQESLRKVLDNIGIERNGTKSTPKEFNARVQDHVTKLLAQDFTLHDTCAVLVDFYKEYRNLGHHVALKLSEQSSNPKAQKALVTLFNIQPGENISAKSEERFNGLSREQNGFTTLHNGQIKIHPEILSSEQTHDQDMLPIQDIDSNTTAAEAKASLGEELFNTLYPARTVYGKTVEHHVFTPPDGDCLFAALKVIVPAWKEIPISNLRNSVADHIQTKIDGGAHDAMLQELVQGSDDSTAKKQRMGTELDQIRTPKCYSSHGFAVAQELMIQWACNETGRPILVLTDDGTHGTSVYYPNRQGSQDVPRILPDPIDVLLFTNGNHFNVGKVSEEAH